MKVDKIFEKCLESEITRLKESGIKLSDWIISYTLKVELNRIVLDDIKKYGKITEQFGPYVCVEIPIDKVVEFLKKDYVINAEPESGVSVLQLIA